MSIAKPFNFTANTYAKASEVNADFDILYAQVNKNISAIAKNELDITTIGDEKANINGSSSQRFAVADPIGNGEAVNKQTMMKYIGNTLDYISGLTITKDSGSPEDTIIVSAGSCYDTTKQIILKLANDISKQNTSQSANSTYNVYIISNNDGVSTDILISQTDPTGTTKYRKIGYYTTDGNGNIDTISYYGEDANSNKNYVNIFSQALSPDFSTIEGLSVNTTYTATEPTWITMFAQSHNNKTVSYWVNGFQYFLSSNANNDTDTAGAGIWLLLGKGDTYYLGSAGSQRQIYLYRFKCKGAV